MEFVEELWTISSCLSRAASRTAEHGSRDGRDLQGTFPMKVVLCYPSLLPGQKPKYGLQPLGVLYIAAVLRQHGIDVTVLDADIDGLTVDEIVERILAAEPDLVGFSLMTPQLMTALEAS